MARDDQRRGLGALPDAPRSGMNRAGSTRVNRPVANAMTPAGSARSAPETQAPMFIGPSVTGASASMTSPERQAEQRPSAIPVRGSVPSQRGQGTGGQQAATPATQPASPRIPEGTYDAPPPAEPDPYAGQRLTGDVGTQTRTEMSASSSSSSAGGAPGGQPSLAPGPLQAGLVAQGIGVQGPGSAPTAEVAPPRAADTSQELRDRTLDQQGELYNRYLQAQEEFASAPRESMSDMQRAGAIRDEMESLAQVLGISTQAGTQTFSANRAVDRSLIGAGIDANAQAAMTNADNRARLGISANRERTNVFGTLMDSADAQRRAEASVAAAQAQNRPTPMEQLQYQLAAAEAQGGSYENAVNIAFNNPDLFGDEELLRDEMGNPTGFVRTRGGSIAPYRPWVLDRIQRFGGDPRFGVEGE